MTMRLPDRIDNEPDLDELLSRPDAADVEVLRRLGGDVLIVGAGGKMGPSLARRAARAAAEAGGHTRVFAASRFASPPVRDGLEAAGVRTLTCDLLDPAQIASLPRCESVLYLVGRKFGTADRSDLTWTTNTVAAARLAEHCASSRFVAFSSGNVYPLVPAEGRGSREEDAPGPVGEYAQSCLGRERVIEYVSREAGMPCLLYRLNYAVELRYGTLVDIAQQVFDGRPVDLTVGWFNAIWQGDANSYALRSLELCESPPCVLNVTGPERISVREIAARFGEHFSTQPRFENTEGALALLSDASRCHARMGPPTVSMDRLVVWIAHWIKSGGATLGKPTHFEVADGRY
jgi:nucleoside-diphosphate-sugar epimerase